MFNKKASLEISIQAIVIVVLAMTLLGLGLAFIRGMFRDISKTTVGVTEAVKRSIIDDLISNPEKRISFPKTEVVIDKGGSDQLVVGIRNKKDTTLYYRIRFNAISGSDGGPFNIENPKWFQYAEQTTYKLPSAENDVRDIRLSIPTQGVTSGSYFLTFDVIDEDLSPPDNIYAQKDFFIVVKG